MSSTQIILKTDIYITNQRNISASCKVFALYPKVIGCFSVDSNRFFKPNTSELKFLVKPRPEQFPLRLNDQLTLADKHLSYREYLDTMLYFIKSNQNTIVKRSPFCTVQADIVTQHDVLETLLRTPYMGRNWRILGTRYRNTIYLCLASPSQAGTPPGALLKDRACQGMEAQLRRYLFSDAPDKLTTSRADGGEFHGVFRCNIGGLSVVYGCTMGAHDNKKQGPNMSSSMFVECKVILPVGDSQIQGSKPDPQTSLIWWSECCLKGVQELYIARPQMSGHIQDLERSYLTSLIYDNATNWSCEVCINFMKHVLQQLCQTMKLDNPNSVYQFDYISNPGILQFSVCVDRSENTFISDWYRFLLDNL